jgi:hypothetical protein
VKACPKFYRKLSNNVFTIVRHELANEHVKSIIQFSNFSKKDSKASTNKTQKNKNKNVHMTKNVHPFLILYLFGTMLHGRWGIMAWKKFVGPLGILRHLVGRSHT